MFSALRQLKHMAARHKFQRMVARFDEQIEEARANHQPVNPIRKAKAEFVRQCLEGRR